LLIGSVAIGDWTLARQTTGQENVAVGSSAWNITTGGSNAILGQYSASSLTTGYNNTVLGSYSGAAITTGSSNVSINQSMNQKVYQWDGTSVNTYGAYSYPVLTDATPNTGSSNIAIGNSALNHNTTGSSNIAIGNQAMAGGLGSGYSITAATPFYDAVANTGWRNIAIGELVLYKNASGDDNIAFGFNSLYKNSSGFRNFAAGVNALYKNTTGTDNIGIGLDAIYSNQTSWGNIGIGLNALKYVTGGKNTAIGHSAGENATTGENNIFIGYNSQPASATDSNKITLGDSNITHLRCQVTSITALSDARDKKNVQGSIYGLDFINKLRPVTFEWDMRDGGKAGQKDLGFLAQDLIEVEDELDAHEILNLTMRSNPDKLEASYGRLVPILVKAVQDLSQEVNDLKQLLKEKDL